MRDKRITRVRGVAGVVVAIAAILSPGQTAYIAVELIGLWAILVGVLFMMSGFSERNQLDKEQAAAA